MGEPRRKRMIVLPGMATHFRVDKTLRRSSCGIPWVEHFSWDPRDVDCVRCRKTKVWRMAMGKDRS